MKSKNCSPLRMADGGMVPIAPSPFSIRGMVNGLRGTADAVASRFQTPAGYTPASQQPMAPAPVMPAPVAPAPAMPQLGGMNMGAMQQREAAAGLADGAARIVPGQRNGNKDTVPAMLTPEEAVLPVDTVDAMGGPGAVADLIDRTHTPVKKQGLRNGMANGGFAWQEDPVPAQQGPSVRTTIPAPAAPPAPTNPDIERLNAGIATAMKDMVTPRSPTIGQSGYQEERTLADTVSGTPGAAAKPTPGGFASDLYRNRENGAAVASIKSAAPATADSVDKAFFPNVRNTLRGAGEDMSAAYTRGDLAGTAGNLLRGTAALVPAVAEDLFRPAINAVAGGGSELGSPIRRFASAVTGGAVSPVGGAGTAAPVAGPANPTDQRLAGGAQTAPTSLPGQEVPGAPGIRRIGNSYTDGSTGGGVSTVGGDSGEATASNLRAAAIYKSIADAAKVDPNQQLTVLDGGQRELAERNAGVKSILGPTGNLQMRQQEIDQQGVRDKMNNAATIRGQDVGAMTAQASNAIAARGQDMSYASTTRGQDSTARTAAAAARVDQMNKDRTFQMDVAKFGEEQAKNRFDQRGKSVDEFSKRVQALIPPGEDGKPDGAGHARVLENANRMVVERQQALQSELQKNPGNAQAAKELDAIERQGVGILGEAQMRQLVQGDRVMAAAGRSSIAGEQSGSTGPRTSLKAQSGVLWDTYKSDRGDDIPKDFIDKTGGFHIPGTGWVVGGRKTDDFNSLKK